MLRTRPIALPCLLALAACSGDATEGDGVERIDSAGIEHVINRSEHRALAWRFEPVLTLGGVDEGPQAFGTVPGVGVDAAGRIYVPDSDAHRVRVFAGDGTLVRAFGGQGGGPGEFEFLAAFAVAPDGSSVLFDFGKRSLVAFDSAGKVLPERPVPTIPSNRLRLVGESIAGVFRTITREAGDTARTRLMIQGARDTIVIITTPVEQRGAPVQLPGCPIALNIPPLLAPAIEWDANADRLVVGAGTDYALEVWEPGDDGTWTRRRRIVRDLAPIASTVEIAAAENPDSFRIRAGTIRCAIGPVEIAETLGFADVAPHLRDVALAPDGSIWVYHRTGTTSSTDVFDASGAYLGTLPEGTPFPYAFRGPDQIVTIEKDELDRAEVVVWRIVR